MGRLDSPIQCMPYLPSTLRVLNCSSTWIIDLPFELPPKLEVLLCDDTSLTSLPELPDSLHTLNCQNTRLPLQIAPGESMAAFIERFREERHKERMMSKMRVLKEGIMQEAWHPRRVERVLALGGREVFDTWMGC